MCPGKNSRSCWSSGIHNSFIQPYCNCSSGNMDTRDSFQFNFLLHWFLRTCSWINWSSRPRVDLTRVSSCFCLSQYKALLSCWLVHVLRILHQFATDLKDIFPVASRLIFNQSFVDDLHGSGYSLSEALLTRDKLISLLSDAGFSLKKWATSSPLLLSGLASSDLFPCGWEKTVDFLGLMWQPSVDTLSFPSRGLGSLPSANYKSLCFSSNSKVVWSLWLDFSGCLFC